MSSITPTQTTGAAPTYPYSEEETPSASGTAQSTPLSNVEDLTESLGQLTVNEGSTASLGTLGPEIQWMILSNLGVRDLQNCNLVSRNLRKVAGDDAFCRYLLKRDFPHDAEPADAVSPREAFVHRHVLSSNLASGKCIKRTIEVPRTAEFLGYDSAKLILRALFDKIIILDLRTGIYSTIVEGRMGGAASTFRYANGMLFSGSWDGTISVFDLTGNCIKTLLGHTSKVTSLVCVDGNLISGSNDTTIRVWNLGTFNCSHTIQSQIGRCITSITCTDREIIVGSDTGRIQITDLETGASRVLEAHNQHITCLDCDADGMLFSGSWDGTIKVWDLKTTGDCVKTLTGDTLTGVTFVHLGNILISGHGTGKIIIWNLKTGTRFNTLLGHQGWGKLYYANGMLCSNTHCDDYKNKMTVWDFNHVDASPLKKDEDPILRKNYGLLKAGTPCKLWKLPEQPKVERLSELSTGKEEKSIESLYDTLRSSPELLTISEYLRLLGIESCTETLSISDTFITTSAGLNTYSDITPLGIDGRNLRLIRDIQAVLPSINQITVADTGHLDEAAVLANTKVSVLNEQIEGLREVEELLQKRCLLLAKCGLTSFDFEKEIETLSASLAQTREGLKTLLYSTATAQKQFALEGGVQDAVDAIGEWLENALAIEQRIQIRLLQTFLTTPTRPGESFETIREVRCGDVSGVFPKE